MNLKLICGSLCVAMSLSANATEYIVKFKDSNSMSMMNHLGGTAEVLMDGMLLIDVPEELAKSGQFETLSSHPSIEYIQPNYKIKLLPMNIDASNAAITQLINQADQPKVLAAADNPAIADRPSNPGSGADPLTSKQWGMKDIGVTKAWRIGQTLGSSEVVVAVIDTGVDYNHEDLIYNMWRNEREIPGNNIDDDGNGFVDDIVGWDFVSNDNKPFDLSVDPFQLITGGGNPGHGTHCAGNVAARANNGKGIVGVAPNVRIMALRFLSEKGQGTTAGAVQAIKYAVQNGAQILSNSWGSEGEEPGSPDNQALKDAIQFAQDNNSLFVAAAGNGHQGVGYDNDTDAKPAYPASYPHDVIVSVAAIDVENNLGAFSNWGQKTVDIGAPGVKVFSTVTTKEKYSDTVFDMLGLTVNWDGTSMATPHVAGAAALYLSSHPNANWSDIKKALLGSAVPISSLSGKSVSGGKLNVERLMQF